MDRIVTGFLSVFEFTGNRFNLLRKGFSINR